MQADIWSLGCVLYEMLAQRHPFEAASMKQLIEKARYSHHPSLHMQGGMTMDG